jgi:hypothetical protein
MNNCLMCDHELVNIVYGMPGSKLIEMAKSEDIALGGCMPDPEKPTLYCYGCGESF